MPKSHSPVTYFVNWVSDHRVAYKGGSLLPNCPLKKFPVPKSLPTALQAPSHTPTCTHTGTRSLTPYFQRPCFLFHPFYLASQPGV